MGLHDRDYYRDRYRDLGASSNSGKRNTKTGHPVSYLVMFAVLWYVIGDPLLERLKARKNANQPTQSLAPQFLNPQSSNMVPANMIPGGIVINADTQGHFRGTALVNNVPMPFMIDTGATTTTIPANMAIGAGLPFGPQVQSNTAGGQITQQLTQIGSLKIGNAEIRNLEAQINPYLNEVLIGMNTLKYFRMAQSGSMLTLTSYNAPEISAEIERPITIPAAQTFRPMNNDNIPFESIGQEQPIKKIPKTWKKTISCDLNKVCKTTYSGH